MMSYVDYEKLAEHLIWTENQLDKFYGDGEESYLIEAATALRDADAELKQLRAELATQSLAYAKLLTDVDQLESDRTQLRAELEAAKEAVDVLLFCKQQCETNPGYDTCVDAITERVGEWYKLYRAALKEGE